MMAGTRKRGKRMALQDRKTTSQQETVQGGLVKGYFLRKDMTDFDYGEKKASFRSGRRDEGSLYFRVQDGWSSTLSTHLELGRMLPEYEYVPYGYDEDGDEEEEDDGERGDEENDEEVIG
jgi:hypothetical protein